ncbi:MAG: hypothetical protein AAF989_15670, partial [Planctomycetota bacterium]
MSDSAHPSQSSRDEAYTEDRTREVSSGGFGSSSIGFLDPGPMSDADVAVVPERLGDYVIHELL